MTLATASNKVIAAGNGLTTAFAFAFPFAPLTTSSLQIIFTDALGNQTIVGSTDYTLVLNQPAAGQIWGLGGTVTYPTVASGLPPIAIGTTLTIARIVADVQATSITNQSNVYPQVTEQALDYEMMAVQQLAEEASRTLQFPIVDVAPNGTLPAAAQRANLALLFDGSGNPIVGAIPAIAVSGAMVPVFQAVTLVAGRAAFGLAIGSNVEAWSSLLDDIAGSAPAKGTIFYYNGTHIVALAPGTAGQFLETLGAAANPAWASVVLRSFLAGLILANDQVTPNTVLDISAGRCADSTNALYIDLAAFTKKTGGTWVAGSGNNAMGTGLTIALGTWYHVFAIVNGGAADIYFDTSVTAANAPAGTTAFRRIGSFKTDGSAHILGFTQDNDDFWLGTPVVEFSGTAPIVRTTLALGGTPPGIAVKARLSLAIDAGTAVENTSLSIGLFGGVLNVAAGSGQSGSASNRMQTQAEVLTDSAMRIDFTASAARTASITSIGYRDRRGWGS